MRGFAGGWGTGGDWQAALDMSLGGLPAGEPADVAILLAHSSYAPAFSVLAARAYERTGARHLIGCSGQGLIATGRELETEPAVVLLTLSLPGAVITPLRLTGGGAEVPASGSDDVRAWLVLGDPYSVDGEQLLSAFATRYPAVPLIGGMASSLEGPTHTGVFLDGRAYADGAVALGVGGNVGVRAVVSQGCMPIGQTWTITGVSENLIETIGNRPAAEVLFETLRELDAETRERAQANLLVGLAMDEYRDTHGIGDFLIRNLLGIQRETGAIAITALPKVGQTVQFQMRDARTADEHLRRTLLDARAALGDEQPAAALLCSCNGRGGHLFGPIDHDPRAVADVFGDIPVAGLFCAGEIGPVGTQNFLHGFTATIALFTTRGT